MPVCLHIMKFNHITGTTVNQQSSANARINENSSECFAIVSDHLSNSKDAVYMFLNTLYKYIKEKYPLVMLTNTFNDGAPSHCKQCFLLADLHPRENEFNINLI